MSGLSVLRHRYRLCLLVFLFVMRENQIGRFVTDVYVDIDDLLLIHRADLMQVFTLVGEHVNAMIADDNLILRSDRERFDGLDAEGARIDACFQITCAAVNDEQ